MQLNKVMPLVKYYIYTEYVVQHMERIYNIYIQNLYMCMYVIPIYVYG